MSWQSDGDDASMRDTIVVPRRSRQLERRHLRSGVRAHR